MPIQNRDLSTSEQRVVFTQRIAAAVTGASYTVINVPYACELQAADFSAFGLSGAPAYKLHNFRWTAAGSTQIELGTAPEIMAVATGISGPAASWSGIASLGSTLLQLQRGDLIQIESSVANTAALELNVSLVVKKSADIVSALGLGT